MPKRFGRMVVFFSSLIYKVKKLERATRRVTPLGENRIPKTNQATRLTRPKTGRSTCPQQAAANAPH